MMKKILLALTVLSITSVTHSQETTKRSNRIDRIALGPGLGYEYGEIGANAIFYPVKNIGLTAGVGYALAGVGYNIGAKLRLVTSPHRIDPYLMGLYGTNATFNDKINSTSYRKSFTGFTAGAGIDFRSKKIHKTGYWSLGIMVPFPTQEARAYQDHLEDEEDFGYSFQRLPIDISIGYHFILY